MTSTAASAPQVPSLDLRHTCGGPGWAFGCTGAAAMRWSPGSGWQPIERAPRDIDIVGPCAEGVLVRTSYPRQLGLWPWGGSQWAYWQGIEGLESAAFVADPRTLVVERKTSDGPVLGVYRVGPTTLEPQGEVPIAGALVAPRLAAFRRGDGGLGIVSAWTVHALDLASGRLEEEARIRWPTDRTFYPGGVVSAGAFVPVGAPVVVVDLHTGGVTPAALPPPTCRAVEHLWRAVLAEDAPRLRRLLQFLAAIARRPLPERYDLVFEGAKPVALVWACGVERAGRALPPERDPALALWRLWLDGESALSAALGAYLGAQWHTELRDGLVRFAGLRLAVLALDPLRRCPPDVVSRNVRELFERLGPSAAPRVLSALSHPDPAVSHMGALAATADEVGAHLVTAAGPRFEAEVRRLSGAADPTTRAVACELVGRQRLRGLADTLVVRLADDEWAVRLWAARSAASVLDPALERSLARAIVHDLDEGVRGACLASLGDEADLATLLDALGDSAAGVRRRAVAQAEKRVPLLGLEPVRELTRAELLETLDAVLILVCIGHGGTVEDETEGLVPLLTGLLEHLAPKGGDGPDDPVLVLRFVCGLLIGGSSALFLAVGPVGRAWARLSARLGRPPDAAPDLSLLAEVAEAVRPEDADVADRLAALAVSEPSGGSPPPPRAGLAARLRALGGPSAEERCVARLRQLAPEPSRLGRLAAYALAVWGGRQERGDFEERITGPDFALCPVAFVAWACRPLVSDPKDLLARLLARRDLPVARRMVAEKRVLDRLSLSESSLPADAQSAFLEQIAKDETLPEPERRSAARSLRRLEIFTRLERERQDDDASV